MTPLASLDWALIVDHLGLIGFACLLALPIGWEREASSPGVGLRTFPLVAAACCGYLLIGKEVLDGSESHARMLYGLMSGIGFIGGGAILKSNKSVSGTSTAAAIWTTGAIGAAVAWHRFEIAIILSGMILIIFHFIAPLKDIANNGDD